MSSSSIRRATWTALVLVATSCMASARERPVIQFDVESELGEESGWTKAYLEDAARVQVRLMDNAKVAPPRRIPVRLKNDPKSQGVGGGASLERLEFTSSSWPKEKFRYWILGHELANLLAHHYGGAGGYPADWWSNGRSPYPLYVSTLVMEELGHREEAAWFRQHHRALPDHELFWRLHEKHGFALFARFFKTIRADRIDLGKIGKPWPHADRLRSLYTVAYLSIAARENLAPLLRAHGIGTKPPDWDQRHPDKPFEPYALSDDDVQRIVDQRTRLFETTKGSSPAAEASREKFRRGEVGPAK